MGFCPPQTFRREQAPALRCAVYLFARRDAFGTVLPGEASIAFPFVGRGEVLRPSPPGAPQGRMRWRRPLAQCRTTASSQVGANCVRPQTSPSARCCREVLTESPLPPFRQGGLFVAMNVRNGIAGRGKRDDTREQMNIE